MLPRMMPTTDATPTSQAAATPWDGPIAQLRRVFQKQRENRWRVAQGTADERLAKLRRLRDGIWASREKLERAIHDDFHKSPAETDLTEIAPTISEINHTLKHLRKWMMPVRVGTPLGLLGSRSEVKLEPKGVVLILSPWNYPSFCSSRPLAAAIAAGNCAILKPSEKTPATGKVIGELIRSLFDEAEVALFEGAADVAEALLDLPFDHIFFTGSTPSARRS